MLKRLLVLILLLVPITASAQAYPTKPLRLVIPFPPGGPADIIGRAAAQKMSVGLGQQVVVDNRGGGNGTIGGDLVAHADPDGYTLLLMPSAMAANASLYSKLPFDFTTDFTGVAGLATFPLVLVSHPSLPVKSVRELIELAKSKPGALNYASAGSGGGAHLAAESFKRAAGIDMVHVPYKGTGPAVLGTVAGQVSLMFASVPSVVQHVKAGKLNALGLTSAKRSAALPDVPTIAEAGVPGYEIVSWFGLVAPTGTPPEITRRLSVEATKALDAPDFEARLQAEGGEPLRMGPDEFTQFLKTEAVRWAKIVREAGAKLE